MKWAETYVSWHARVLSVLRIMTGLLFLQYGMAKLLKFPAVPAFKDVTLFSLVGLAGTLELVGGALMVLGLFTRPVAFILAGEMAFAYFIGHAPRGFFLLRRRRIVEPRCLARKARTATRPQRPSVAGLISTPSVAENAAPHRRERKPNGLLPGLLTPPGTAPRSPVST